MYDGCSINKSKMVLLKLFCHFSLKIQNICFVENFNVNICWNFYEDDISAVSEIVLRTQSVCAIFLPSHILEGRTQRAMAPHSNSAEIFIQCIYPQVSSSYVYLFGSCGVDKQTNKRRWKHPTLFATLRRWVKSRQTHSTHTHTDRRDRTHYQLYLRVL